MKLITPGNHMADHTNHQSGMGWVDCTQVGPIAPSETVPSRRCWSCWREKPFADKQLLQHESAEHFPNECAQFRPIIQFLQIPHLELTFNICCDILIRCGLHICDRLLTIAESTGLLDNLLAILIIKLYMGAATRAHHSFGMTTTKTLRSVFSWCASFASVFCFWLIATEI